MTDRKKARNYAAVVFIGTVVTLFTLWLPWIFHPVEVLLRRDGVDPESFSSDLGSLLRPFSTTERGLDGEVALGVPVPSWIFIILAALAGLFSMLNILKIYEVSHMIAIGLLAVSGIFLTYWVGSAVAEGSKLQAGLPVALVGFSAIFVATFKYHRSRTKQPASNGT